MRRLTLRTDPLAELTTDELDRVVAARHTLVCGVEGIVNDLLTGMCINPPPTENQLACLTQGCS